MPKRSLNTRPSDRNVVPGKYQPISLGGITQLFESKKFLELQRRLPPILSFSHCVLILYQMDKLMRRGDKFEPPLGEILKRIINRLNDGILAEPAIREWVVEERNAIPKLSFLLYNLGCTVSIGKRVRNKEFTELVRLSAIEVNALLRELDQHRLNGKNIGNCLYGLGQLVKSGLLEGEVDSRLISALLERLSKDRDINLQAISNSLHSLALLAQAGQLKGTIDSRLIFILLKCLNEGKNIKPQSIGNSLYGLGQLARAGLLEGKVDSQLLSDLLWKLREDANTIPQNICQSLHSLGLLAQAGQLEGKVDSQVISALLKRLNESEGVVSQAIGNSLYGLGLVAKTGLLEGKVDSRLISDLLWKLKEGEDTTPQNIGNSLYSLGLLAQAGQLEGKVDSRLISDLLWKLKEAKDTVPQNIGNSLYGLSLLAQAGQLEGKVESRAITASLERLNDCEEAEVQAISNTLWGLACLVKSGKSSADVSSIVIQPIMNRLISLSPKLIGAYQVLFSLSVLVSQGSSLQNLLTLEQLEALLNPVLDSYLHPSRAAELIHALACFKQQNPVLDEVFQTLFDALSIVDLQRLPQRLLTQLKEDKVLLAFAPQWQMKLQSYLEPPALAQQNLPSLSSSFSELPALNNNSEYVSGSPEASLMPTEHRVAEGVSSFRQRHQPSLSFFSSSAWEPDSHNRALFKAIAENDLKAFTRLLQIQRTHGLTARPQQTAYRPVATSQRQAVCQAAEEHVREFFQETPTSVLRQLIACSKAKYFVLLLEACSLHGCYELAKQHGLHPLLIHLPINQLDLLINKLLSPLQLYRDHRALFALIDALTIRLDQEPESRAILVNLQKKLINESLRFHRLRRHHHVVEQLEGLVLRMEQQVMVLEDVIELDREAPAAILSTARPDNRRAQPQAERANPVCSERRVNKEYFYTAEDIHALLLARLKGHPSVEVLAAAHLNAYGVYGQLADILSDFFATNSQQTRTPRTLLLPIAVGEHWIGLKLRYQEGKILDAVYFNSLGSENAVFYQHTIAQQLEEANLLAPGFQFFRNKNELQQPDRSSCGAFLVENMVCDITKESWRRPVSAQQQVDVAQKMRAYHLRLMKNDNPHRYHFFAQQNNGSTLTVNRQLSFFNNNNSRSADSSLCPAANNLRRGFV